MKTLLKYVLLVLLIVQPIAIFLFAYDPLDCDDKAVHYYSAAMSQADQEKSQNISKAIPWWLSIDPLPAHHQRLTGRLLGWQNYTMNNATMACLKAWTVGNSWKPHYSAIVKASSLLLFFLSYFYLLFLFLRSPLGIWPILLCHTALTLLLVYINDVDGRYPLNMMPFFSYVPRGQALFFFPAILLCYADKQKPLFLLSALLLLLWHIGVGIITFSLITLAILVNSITLRQLSGESSRGSGNIFYVLSLLILVFIPILISRQLNLVETATTIRLYTFEPYVIASAALLICFVLLTAWLGSKSGIISKDNNFHTRLFTITSTSLILLLGAFLLFQNPSVIKYLTGLTKIHLIGELSNRLFGPIHYLGVFWLVYSAWLCWTKYKSKFKKLNGIPALALLLFFYFGFVHKSFLYINEANFFTEDCREINPLPIIDDDLSYLDPMNEPVFFSSLGDYLFKP